MNAARLTLALSLVALLIGVGLYVYREGASVTAENDPKDDSKHIEVRDSHLLRPLLSYMPSGVWWCEAEGTYLLVSMEGTSGVAVIMRGQEVTNWAVTLTLPTRSVTKIDGSKTIEIPDAGRLLYTFTRNDAAHTWRAEGSVIETGSDDLDAVLIDEVRGDTALRAPWTLRWAGTEPVPDSLHFNRLVAALEG